MAIKIEDSDRRSLLFIIRLLFFSNSTLLLGSFLPYCLDTAISMINLILVLHYFRDAFIVQVYKGTLMFPSVTESMYGLTSLFISKVSFVPGIGSFIFSCT